MTTMGHGPRTRVIIPATRPTLPSRSRSRTVCAYQMAVEGADVVVRTARARWTRTCGSIDRGRALTRGRSRHGFLDASRVMTWGRVATCVSGSFAGHAEKEFGQKEFLLFAEGGSGGAGPRCQLCHHPRRSHPGGSDARSRTCTDSDARMANAVHNAFKASAK